MTSLFEIVINLNYILFTKLPWSGDSKGVFRSLSQAPSCFKFNLYATYSNQHEKLTRSAASHDKFFGVCWTRYRRGPLQLPVLFVCIYVCP